MKKFLQNKLFLHLILGFLIASSFFLYLEYRYEEKTTNAFIKSIYSDPKLDNTNNEAVILAAMHKTHLQMKQNEISSMGMHLSPVEELTTSPLSLYALTKDGACGGNTLVLAQILQGVGFEVRPGHMLTNNTFGGHIILEVKNNDKWVVLDPLYDLSFKTANGSLASFAEVHSNWDFYKKQVPNNYDFNYKYEGIEYTNWKKIPFLGAFAKSSIALFAGKQTAETFCFRKYFLQPKKIMFLLSIYLLGFSFISILNKRYIKITFSFSKLFAFKKSPSLVAP